MLPEAFVHNFRLETHSCLSIPNHLLPLPFPSLLSIFSLPLFPQSTDHHQSTYKEKKVNPMVKVKNPEYFLY